MSASHRMLQSPRLHFLPWVAAAIAATAFVIESYTTREELEIFSPDSQLKYERFGWPLPFLEGWWNYVNFDREQANWAEELWNTVHPALLPWGCAVDILVCIVLAVSAATATRWLLDRLRPQFTLGVMFGL